MNIYRRCLSACCVLVLIIGLIGGLSPARSSAAQQLAPDSIPGQFVDILAGPPSAKPIRRREILPANAVRTATINVTYGAGYPANAQAAFEAAANVWETKITSAVPIQVNAAWTALSPGVLGSAGPTAFRRDFPNAPVANTFYPAAIANKLAGSDLDPANPEISANFSSSFSNWYFGTDGNTPAGQYDFASVVLHELGHGLGFVGSMSVSGGNGSWGAGSGFPFIYDRFAVNGSGALLITAYPNNSAALGSALTNNSVFFNGPNARAANGNANVPLYAPTTWSQGSSYSHLAESFNGTPNSLMTYSIAPGETIQTVGPVILGMFQDMGWTVASPNGSIKTFLPLLVKPAVNAVGLVNGNFESAGGWTQSSTNSATLIDVPPTGVAAHSGSRVAWLGGLNNETSTIQQSVAVPAGSPAATFWYQVRSTEPICGFDDAALQINGTSVWTKELCPDNVTSAWVSQTVNLAAYAGQTVALTFSATTDSADVSSFLVDDVTLP